MPTLTDDAKKHLLAGKVSSMSGTAQEIADELNDATVETVQVVTTDGFLEAVSPGAYAQILSIANDPAANGHAQAAWLVQALDSGEVQASANTTGRDVLMLLLNSGILSDAESQALIDAATTEVQQGNSWGEANGFGRIYPEFIRQVQ